MDEETNICLVSYNYFFKNDLSLNLKSLRPSRFNSIDIKKAEMKDTSTEANKI